MVELELLILMFLRVYDCLVGAFGLLAILTAVLRMMRQELSQLDV